MLQLIGDGAEVDIAPEAGGALARYEVKSAGTWWPVLLASADGGRSGAFALACNVLAPWSNRISGGGFSYDDRFHPLEPNIAGEPFPNHGNAFSSEWSVADADGTRAVLTLSSAGPGPFRYDARLQYTLEGRTLRMRLSLTNTADLPLPYGGGFHPWFPRTERTRLGFRAAGVWTETADHLPDRFLMLRDHPEWDFSTSPSLPQRLLNNAFTGWTGEALISWPERGFSASITADDPLRTLILFTPQNSSFISVEPVSHSVDAHNRDGPGVASPRRLTPGETLMMNAVIAPAEM